jgi:thymidylate synthase (FAD)
MPTEVTFDSTVTVQLIDAMGDDDSIVKAMLVSSQGEASKDAIASEGRIKFLMKNRHGTPFEHNAMTFFVAAPIFVFREFHRHRIGFSYNEMSGRYKQLPAKFYLPNPDRPLVQIGKPGEYKYVKGEHKQYVDACKLIKESCEIAYDNYDSLLQTGIAKEIARSVLPVNIYSEMYVTCNARSLMAFLSLRTDDPRAAVRSTPMYEINMVATLMEEALKIMFPLTYKAFNECGRQAP